MKYVRESIEVEAAQYELGKGMEDGFMTWTSIVTNGWVSTEKLIKITREDGVVVSPFIQNRRGMIFLREGDYIIEDKDGHRHVCGEDKFHERYRTI